MAKSFIANPTTQNGIDYVRSLEKLLNTKKKELTKKQQEEIIGVYTKAYKDTIEKGLKKAGNDPKKIDKLTKAYATQIYNELNDLVVKYNTQMSEQIVKMQGDIITAFLDTDDKKFMAQVNKLVDITNRKTIQQMIQGNIYNDNKGLSERLWYTSKVSGNKIRTAINSCIAQGMGAADMSEVLKEFAMGGHHTWSRNKIREKLGPGYARKYIGGLDYEALRLARTTLTHQAQIAVINSSKINPYLQFVKWHSDHQAGRTCQQCIDRDGQLFKIDEVPLDHPNGMCWIQPVYSIDGKTEATPEEIARDMKAWGQGEKNSGLMDTIPEYKGLGGKSKPKETIPEGALYTATERKAKYKELRSMLKDELPRRTQDWRVDDIITTLQQAPLHVQDMYLSIGKFRLEPHNKRGAYYAPWEGKMFISLEDKYNNRIRFGDKHRYDVLFHEWGHLIDNQWTTDKKWATHSFDNDITSNTKLSKAFEKDMKNWMKALQKKEFDFIPKSKQLNDLLDDRFAEFLRVNEKHTIALQDAARGLTKGRISTKWGHDLNYYKAYAVPHDVTPTQSAHVRVSSELWAEVNAGMMHEDTRAFLEENFPTLVNEYHNMVKEILKNHKK